ncbi:MAG: antibiotic biosynthesis monooxygenase family protein [Pseudomonadota bacterium]
MIVVRITLNVIPEKQLEVMQTLVSMIEPTGKEAGCISYCVVCDIKDKNCFSLLEEWKTRENLVQHLMSYRFGILMGISTLLCKPLEISIHTVSRSEGIETIAKARTKAAL